MVCEFWFWFVAKKSVAPLAVSIYIFLLHNAPLPFVQETIAIHGLLENMRIFILNQKVEAEKPPPILPPPPKKKKKWWTTISLDAKKIHKEASSSKKINNKNHGMMWDPNIRWRDPNIPWKDPNIPWRDPNIPWKESRFNDVGLPFYLPPFDLLWHAPVWRSVDPSFLDDSPGGVNALTRKGTAVPRLFFVPLDSECRIIRDFGERISVRFFLKKGIFEVEL